MTAAPILRIEHIVSADDPFGEAWPPDGSVSIVRRTGHGFTLWRRISLQTTTPPSIAAARPRGSK
jgi:hypothetical protein